MGVVLQYAVDFCNLKLVGPVAINKFYGNIQRLPIGVLEIAPIGYNVVFVVAWVGSLVREGYRFLQESLKVIKNLIVCLCDNDCAAIIRTRVRSASFAVIGRVVDEFFPVIGLGI